MKKFIISLFAVVFLLSACKKDPVEGYWKMTFTADVAVSYTGPKVQVGCVHSGYIGAVLYFPANGGDVVYQESFVTIDTLYCAGCYAEMRSQTDNIPITLNASLDVASVEIRESDGAVLGDFNDFKIWMENPQVFSIDIYYDCGGAPDVLPDYGNAVSQITSPFLTQIWSFTPKFELVQNSTFEGYTFPPNFICDIDFEWYQEFVDAY